MATPLSISGWTSDVIKGGSVSTSAPTNTTASLKTTASDLNDSKLASKQYTNPLTGKRSVATAASVYKQAEIPSYLQQAVNDLNDTQTAAKNNLTSWQNKLLDLYESGGDNAYMIANALQASSVQPGAHTSLSSVENPKYGEGYLNQANAAADVNTQKSQSISDLSTMQNELTYLNNKKSNLGGAMFGQYTGSEQEKLDQQISALEAKIKNQKNVATAAAGSNSSGWVSTPSSGYYGSSSGSSNISGVSLPTR